MKKVSITLLSITIVLMILSFIFLPNEVKIQLSIDGSFNTTSKYLAILVPTATSIFGCFACYAKKDTGYSKGYVVSIICIIVLTLDLIVNLL